MRIFVGLITVLLPFLCTGIAYADPSPVPGSNEARESYAIGYQAVDTLQRHGRTTDLAALLRGALDALSGNPLIGEQERQALLKDLQPPQTGPGVRDELTPIRQGEQFLAANAGKPGVTTLPSGLQYRIIHTGTGRKPGMTDAVAVHYVGSLVDGTEIDSSNGNDKPAVYRLDEVMPGWAEALQLMPEGSEWELYIPSRLAYGKRGPLENQVLIYRIRLLTVIKDAAAAATP